MPYELSNEYWKIITECSFWTTKGFRIFKPERYSPSKRWIDTWDEISLTARETLNDTSSVCEKATTQP